MEVQPQQEGKTSEKQAEGSSIPSATLPVSNELNGTSVPSEGNLKKKRKITKYHRTHAHRNPLSDGGWKYPASPDLADWSEHYPHYFPAASSSSSSSSSLSSSSSSVENKKQVDFADVGCGYGGLLVALGEHFPDNLSLGIEIRNKVVEYVRHRITKLREENASSHKYSNISVLSTNAMKYLPNFFFKGQLKKIFFLFPDPHFKKSNHRRRIISPSLISEYAYVLAEGAKLYTVTDVKELYDWQVTHLDACPLFYRASDEENQADPVVSLVLNSSEESKKVDKAKGHKYLAVYIRKPNLTISRKEEG